MKLFFVVVSFALFIQIPIYSQTFEEYIDKGDSCVDKQAYSSAIAMYYKALDLKNETQIHDEDQLEVLVKIADAYSKEGNYRTSQDFLMKYVQKKSISKNSALLADAYNKIGINFDYLNDFDQALEYYYKCIEHTDSSSIKSAKAHNNIANILIEKGKYQLSKSNYLKALKVFEKENYFSGRIAVYMNLSEIELKSNKVETALYYLENAEDLALSQKDTLELVSIRIALAQFFTHITDYDQAEENLNWCLLIAKRLNNKNFILDIYQSLSLLFKKKHNFEISYNYLVLFHELSDSINRVNANKAYAQLERKYQLSENEKENIILKSQQDIIETQVRTQRLFIWVLLILFFVSILFIILFYSQRLKTNKSKKALEVQNKKIKKSETQLRDLNHQYEKLIEHYEGGSSSKRETLELT